MIRSTIIAHLDSVRNIVVAGETGVGKSSLINLIIGEARCETGNDVRGVTAGTEYHDWTYDDQTFRLWDTPGLGEGSFGTVPPRQAQDALRLLLSELKKGTGAHLLILCMRGTSKVTKGMKQTYDTVARIRDKVSPDTPLVAVITELEKRSALPDIISSMEDWWTINLQVILEFQMEFSGHACITTFNDESYPKLPGRHKLCQGHVRNLIVRGVSPKIARNVIVVGEVGVGKSSLVNLVLGVEQAPVGNDASPVTISPTYYEWDVHSQVFRLWDTPGIGEGLRGGAAIQRRALEGLRSLFADLSAQGGGVQLLIFCVRGFSKVMAATKRTYDHIMKLRDKYCPATPIVAVITELERQSNTIPSDVMLSMEQWWRFNSGVFSENGILFADHACITCLPDECEPSVVGRREACQAVVRALMIKRSLHPRTGLPKDLNVMLFGETGVGKSSLVNLLAGGQIASVSSDSTPCTLDAQEFQFPLGRITIRLWDTVGLEEPDKDKDKDKDGYYNAIEKAIALIKRLNRAGGISLFLFCIRGNRITQTTQSNYRLFYEVLGKKEVPIAVVVTNLERELGDMEEWWQKNVKQVERNGIHSAGHACITALDGHQRYAESKIAMLELLSKFDEQGKFLMPSEAWIGRIIKGLGSLVEKSFPRGKDLVKVLTKRCSLEPEVAQRVADCIDADG